MFTSLTRVVSQGDIFTPLTRVVSQGDIFTPLTRVVSQGDIFTPLTRGDSHCKGKVRVLVTKSNISSTYQC